MPFGIKIKEEVKEGNIHVGTSIMPKIVSNLFV